MKREVQTSIMPAIDKDLSKLLKTKDEDKIHVLAEIMKQQHAQKAVLDMFKILTKYSKKKKESYDEFLDCVLKSCDKQSIQVMYDIVVIVSELFKFLDSKEFDKVSSAYFASAQQNQQKTLKRLGDKLKQ